MRAPRRGVTRTIITTITTRIVINITTITTTTISSQIGGEHFVRGAFSARFQKLFGEINGLLSNLLRPGLFNRNGISDPPPKISLQNIVYAKLEIPLNIIIIPIIPIPAMMMMIMIIVTIAITITMIAVAITVIAVAAVVAVRQNVPRWSRFFITGLRTFGVPGNELADGEPVFLLLLMMMMEHRSGGVVLEQIPVKRNRVEKQRGLP